MSTPSTREVILLSASRLFATRGYSAVSMRDVASAVGVTPANLYHHFKDKKELIRESLAFVFINKMKPIESLMSTSEEPAQRVEMLLLLFSRLLMEDEIFAKLLMRELLDGDGERLRFLAQNVFQSSFSILVQLIYDYFETTNPVFFAISLVGAVIGHYHLSGMLHHLKEGRPEHGDPEIITRQLMEELRFKVRTKAAHQEAFHG